jgi:hypothetical protein
VFFDEADCFVGKLIGQVFRGSDGRVVAQDPQSVGVAFVPGLVRVFEREFFRKITVAAAEMTEKLMEPALERMQVRISGAPWADAIHPMTTANRNVAGIFSMGSDGLRTKVTPACARVWRRVRAPKLAAPDR